ncbi:MAG: hypothetical protein Q8O57_07775 [Kiritimatiellota bacterium]|nr:hypothetical protein [Kiritimatiellota bacterium]
MERWIQVFLNLVDNLLKHPGTPLEKWSLIIPGCLFFLWVYARTSRAFGTPHFGGSRGVFTAVLGIAFVLAAMTAVSLYFPKAGPWLWVGVPVVVSLVVVMPLVCLIQRAGFMAAFMTWLISVAALAAIILLISAGFDAFNSGREQAEKSKVHKQEIEQLIGKRR